MGGKFEKERSLQLLQDNLLIENKSKQLFDNNF